MPLHCKQPEIVLLRPDRSPPEIASYSIMHLVGDVTGLVEALGEKQAIIVGHDWGRQRGLERRVTEAGHVPGSGGHECPVSLSSKRRRGQALRDAGLYTYYWLYYQDPGVAAAEYDRDPRATLRRRMYTSSGDAPQPSRPIRPEARQRCTRWHY